MSAKQIILGTAGHIDHGKTSLIKKATGINTDRLKEEKLRGITIELGFASLALPNGKSVGIVDVPGHEKFVKNMVAGATGIDLVAMVIAADEGVMPQTREHMEICTLLGITHGFVVLTKIDMVDEEWLELVTEDVKTFLAGTFLEQAPIVAFSAVTGQGLERFIEVVADISASIPERHSSGILRLPIDRVFSMKGFGTVITGTLTSGRVAVGEKVMIYPSEVVSKVRGLQVHNQSMQTAVSGMRTAINFQGLEKTTVNRGDIVATPDAMVPSFMVDILLNYLPSNKKALKNRQRVRLHTGTSEIMAVVVLLDREELPPGQSAFAQLRLDTPVTLVKDDHYVLRSYSPVRTIGGGKVLDPIPEKHKRNKPDIAEHLSILAASDPEEVVRRQIEVRGFEGCSFRNLRLMGNLQEKQLEMILQKMMSHQQVVQVDKEKRSFIHHSAFDLLQQTIEQIVGAYHKKNALKAGMPKEELKSQLPASIGVKLFTLALNQMIKNDKLAQQEDIVHLPAHTINLGADQKTLRRQIVEFYLQGGITPPYFKEIVQQLDAPEDQARQVLSLLVSEAVIVKVKEDLYYHREPLSDLQNRLVAYLEKNQEISTPQFKDMTGASRKFVIALIEYFDNIQLTIRVGDIRQLRRRPPGS